MAAAQGVAVTDQITGNVTLSVIEIPQAKQTIAASGA